MRRVLVALALALALGVVALASVRFVAPCSPALKPIGLAGPADCPSGAAAAERARAVEPPLVATALA
jgi:hypothetical protein